MSSVQLLLRYLAAVCLAALVFGSGHPGQPGMFNYPDPEMELESRVDQIEAKQAMADQRQRAMTSAFSGEMTTLTKDTSAIKTTVTRLVEDSVQMMGRIRILQDVGSDVVDLRKSVSTIEKDVGQKVSQVQTQVNSVSGKLEQLASANTYITVGLSTQMKQNKELLRVLQNTVTQLDKKIKATEQKIVSLESAGSTPGVAALEQTVTKLEQKLETLEGNIQEQIETILGKIAEIQR